ncbi:MAG: hypothetical protein WD623_07790 [Marinobacter sp.]|uniref:hypothetical protein n=1 Tax=Marinobacter sp. TaxID=50741 RepID=UPI0034A066F4
MLRTAIAKTVEDPEFLNDAENQSLSINFVAGEENQTVVQEAYEYPDDEIVVTKNAN